MLTNGGAGEGPDPRARPVLDLLAYGQPAATPFDGRSTIDRRFTLVLDRGAALVDGTPAYAYTVNGRPTRALPRVRTGRRSGRVHRGEPGRRGSSVAPARTSGVGPVPQRLTPDRQSTVAGHVRRPAGRGVAGRVPADNPGLWMNHCHNLGHADQGMALHPSRTRASSHRFTVATAAEPHTTVRIPVSPGTRAWPSGAAVRASYQATESVSPM
jgi:Multicopper oxidase